MLVRSAFRRKRIFGLIHTLSIALGVSALTLSFSLAGIEVETLRTHSRLSLGLDDGVQTEFKTTATGFEWTIRGMSLADLGAPLGGEEAWIERFKQGLKDPRLSTLTFKEVDQSTIIIGTWKFPTGPNAPVKPEMQAFDYVDSEHSRAIVDFWVKEGVSVAVAQAARKTNLKKAKISAAKAQGASLAKARQERIQELAITQDVAQFCERPLNAQDDVQIPLLPAHEAISFNKWFSTTTPDSRYNYYVPTAEVASRKLAADATRPAEGETESQREASYVRLALKLYESGKNALVLKTLDFFDAEHSRSPYKTEMTFLRANALIKLGMIEPAEKILNALMVDAKATPEALYSGMYLAAKRVSQQSFLSALETFLWLIENHSDHRMAWVFHLGAAESLAALKQTERAAKEYQWVVENAKDPLEQAKAAARIGDLYLDRFAFENALGAYFQAYNSFKDEAATIPALRVNRAEALFQLGQNERAQDEFEKFLEYFPAHPDGWRATYRLGELTGRVGARNKNQKSRDWFIDTANRYPFSPGAVLARMQLFSCESAKDRPVIHREVERFFEKEVPSFLGKKASSDIPLTAFRNFESLARVRSYARFLPKAGYAEKAIQTAIAELDDPTKNAIHVPLSEIYTTLARKHVLSLIEAGKEFDAIQFFEKSEPKLAKWLGSGVGATSGTPIDYLLTLAQSASNLGLSNTALRFTARFREAESKRSGRTIASDQAGSSLAGKGDALDLRLKRAEHDFSEAKALWLAIRQKANQTPASSAKGTIEREQVRSLLSTVSEESPHFIERSLILAVMDEQEGKFEQALAHVARAQLNITTGIARHRISAWIAQLQNRLNNLPAARDLYREIENTLRMVKIERATDTANEQTRWIKQFDLIGVPGIPALEEVLASAAEVEERAKNWGKAAEIYDRMAASGLAKNHAHYGKARMLLRSGDARDRVRALGLLEQVVKEGTDDFWKKLASETLANETLKNAKEGTP